MDNALGFQALGYPFESRSEPFLLKYLLIGGGGDVCPPMSKLVKISLISDVIDNHLPFHSANHPRKIFFNATEREIQTGDEFSAHRYKVTQ